MPGENGKKNQLTITPCCVPGTSRQADHVCSPFFPDFISIFRSNALSQENLKSKKKTISSLKPNRHANTKPCATDIHVFGLVLWPVYIYLQCSFDSFGAPCLPEA